MVADDKEDLVSRSIKFRRYTFSFREIVLIVATLVAMCLIFVFAGLFGHKTSDLDAVSSKLTGIVRSQCNDKKCLETMAFAATFLNTSRDPCDNFYQFACSGYKEARSLNPGQEFSVNVLQELMQDNEDRLQKILSGGKLPETLSTSSAERKVKDFYASCMDEFTADQLKGTPLINKVSPLLSYLINANFDSDTWKFGRSLGQVHADLWLDVLYSPRVKVDQAQPSQRIIAIYPGGAGYYMKWKDYTTNPTPKQRQLQDDYKKFIRTVAQLIARDASVPSDLALADRIAVFVDDVYFVESKIASFAASARYQTDAFSEARKVTLDQLKQTTGNEIDWTVQMSYMFNEASVTGSTKVVIPYPTYLTNITAMIRSLDPQARNRKLHNYLTWRVLERYIQDLSGEYRHANRQFYVDKYGTARFLGTTKYCFRMAKIYFDIALGALYVNSQFDARNKNKVTDITETVKTALETMITNNNWMDPATKAYATDKMKSSTYKIGYPDFMTDESKVDAIYQKLSINQTDLLGNVLACNQEHRREWNRRLREGEDRSEWFFNTYDTNLAVWWYWDEIIVPAGILQFPMYDHDMPHYYSFGAIGSILGHFIHHLIDEKGRVWDKGGDYMKTTQGWWSNETVQNYNQAKQCVADLYNNVTQGPYIARNGDQTTIAVNGKQFAWEAIAITTGIRLAYNAYQSWQQKYGQDSYSPGLQYSPLQLFFIAHAQTYCYNRDPYYDYYYTLWRKVNEETRVNVALRELPEFQQAFQCRPTDKMVSPKPCTYY